MAMILLGAMLVAAPLPFGSVYTWAWASLSLLALLILLIWLLGTVRQGKLSIGYSPLYLPAVLGLALGLAQLGFHLTLTPAATRESLLKFGTYLLIFFVVVQLFANVSAETWRGAGLALLVFTFVFSLLSILQFLWNPARILWVDHDLARSPFGPYVDRDHYAGLMEMLIPLSAAYVLSRRKHAAFRGVLWFGLLVPVVSLLLTGSRGGVLALLAEFAILGWILVYRYPQPGRHVGIAVVGLALVGAAALFFWLAPHFILDKLGSASNYIAETGQQGRVTLWKNSLGIVRDHPLTGTGMGSFVNAYTAYQTEAIDLTVEHAHNDYIEVLAETGLLGGALLLAALWLFYSITFGNLPLELRAEPGWMRLGAAISCCGLLVHSFFDFNLHIPANAVWFAFCAGLACLAGVPAVSDRPRPD